MTNKERKHNEIHKDFKDLLRQGKTLEMVMEMIGYKYYMTPDSVYNIYYNKQKEETPTKINIKTTS